MKVTLVFKDENDAEALVRAIENVRRWPSFDQLSRATLKATRVLVSKRKPKARNQSQ